jgi:hypothetical protein
MNNAIFTFVLFWILVLTGITRGASADWASEVIEYVRNNGHPLYTNAVAALGPAARITPDSLGGTGDVPVRVNEGVWSPEQIVSIGNGGHLILKMGQVITNDSDPWHPYGIDLIVYGNCFFSTLLSNQYALPWAYSHTDNAEIWVSNATSEWYRVEGVYADALMPTQSIDINGNPSDYLLPVNPALLTNDWFDGTWSYTNTVMTYEGAAGGAPIDLSNLVTADGTSTNLSSAMYVKLVDVSGESSEIDAIARVRTIPEPELSVLLLLLTAWKSSRSRRPCAGGEYV